MEIHPDLEALATDIDLLDPLEPNPRQGDVEAIMRSYEAFGQRKPIVATRHGKRGTVSGGNHQLKAAKLLGWKQIAVVFTDDDEATEAAFALADNKTGNLGGYDSDVLAELLATVATESDLLKATAYSENEIRHLLGENAGIDYGGMTSELDAFINSEEKQMADDVKKMPADLTAKLTFVMKPEDRDAVVAWLRSRQTALELPTAASVLLWLSQEPEGE